jgi:hypothetical protein
VSAADSNNSSESAPMQHEQVVLGHAGLPLCVARQSDDCVKGNYRFGSEDGSIATVSNGREPRLQGRLGKRTGPSVSCKFKSFPHVRIELGPNV